MKEEQGLSIQRGCACVGLALATFYRPGVDWPTRDSEVIAVLNELVEACLRVGAFGSMPGAVEPWAMPGIRSGFIGCIAPWG